MHSLTFERRLKENGKISANKLNVFTLIDYNTIVKYCVLLLSDGHFE